MITFTASAALANRATSNALKTTTEGKRFFTRSTSHKKSLAVLRPCSTAHHDTLCPAVHDARETSPKWGLVPEDQGNVCRGGFLRELLNCASD